MRSLSVLLLCSACSSLEGKQQAAQECHKYQMPITVGGTQEQAGGRTRGTAPPSRALRPR
jgi:hypothetical protein